MLSSMTTDDFDLEAVSASTYTAYGKILGIVRDFVPGNVVHMHSSFHVLLM